MSSTISPFLEKFCNVGEKWFHFIKQPFDANFSDTHPRTAYACLSVGLIPGCIAEMAIKIFADIACIFTAARVDTVCQFAKECSPDLGVYASATPFACALCALNPGLNKQEGFPDASTGILSSLLETFDNAQDNLTSNDSWAAREITSRLTGFLLATAYLITGVIEGAIGLICFVFALVTLGQIKPLFDWTIAHSFFPNFTISLQTLANEVLGPKPAADTRAASDE